MAGLVKTLGGVHGRSGRETEAGVRFDLESGGRKGDGGGFDSLALVDGGDGIGGIFKGSEEGFRFVEGLRRIFFESRGESRIFRIEEETGDFKGKLFAEFFDFALFFDDEAKRGALDATSGDGARNFSADNARKVETDEQIEGLAGLLGRNHRHIDGSRVFYRVFKGWFGDFVESDAVSLFREVQNFEKMPRNRLSLAVFIGREPDFIGGFRGFF